MVAALATSMRTLLLLVTIASLGILGCEGSVGFVPNRTTGTPPRLISGRDAGVEQTDAAVTPTDAAVTRSADARVVTADAPLATDARPSCVPMCSGRACGADGCGGSCGSCAGSQTCSAAGQCVGGGGGAVVVTIYAGVGCGVCNAAKSWMNANSVPFTEVVLPRSGSGWSMAAALDAARACDGASSAGVPTLTYRRPDGSCRSVPGWSPGITEDELGR